MTPVKMVPKEETMDIVEEESATGNDLDRVERSDVEHSPPDARLSDIYIPTHSFVIDRWFDHLPWPRGWSIALIGVLLLLILAVMIWMSDGFEGLPTGVSWFRPIFPPIVIVYLLVVVQVLQRTREEVAHSLRPLVQVDDETFVDIVTRACRANPVGELVGFGIGAAFIS